MKLLRPLVVLAGLVLLLATVALWWNSPSRVDMSTYAPADALIYVEINSLSDVTKAIQDVDILREVSPLIGMSKRSDNKWLAAAARAGLAPTQAVISRRAQIALVVVSVNTAEKDDSLRVKPDVALIVETQTAKWRMKGTAIESIGKLAQFAYGAATCTERVSDADYVECVETKGTRKLIGAIDASVVIVGNSEKAVEHCLAVRRNRRPSMHTDPEFLQARSEAKGQAALAFGYVSQANAAKLVSLGTPLLFGKGPGDSKLEDLLSSSASKVLKGISWISKPVSGGIEDSYEISLEPEVLNRLEPAFETADAGEDFWRFVPDSFRSLTIYRSKDPQAAWSSLDSAVAMKLDAVSTVIVASLLKSGLSGYGVENPREFLGQLTAPLITIRPALGDESLLLARVKSEEQLRKTLSADFLKENRGQILSGLDSEPNRDKEFAAVVVEGFIVLGKTENVLVYLAQLRNKETITLDHFKDLKESIRSNAASVTYTNEQTTIRTVLAVLSRFNGRSLSDNELDAIESRLEHFKHSRTESSLSETGIDRRTKSSFGQFGNLLSFAAADSSNAPTR